MNAFRTLLTKEIKELLVPQIILPLILTVLVFGFLGKVIGSEQEKTNRTQPLVLVDRDSTVESQIVKKALELSGFSIQSESAASTDSAIAKAKETGATSVVVVPEGFATGVNAGTAAQVIETYSIVKKFSVFAAQDSARLQAGIEAVNQALSLNAIDRKLPTTDAQVLKNPVTTKETVVVGEKQAAVGAAAILGFINSQTTIIPIILFFVITFAAQMIASAVASEKENKTLETLLSLPVKREHIVAAKMLAAGLVAAGASALYLVGFRSYISGINGADGTTDAVKAAATTLGLNLHGSQYVLLGLSLFAAILTALAIALILGAFAEDVKSAQGLVAPIMVLILVPYLLTFFLDPASLSPVARYALLAIPFSHPFLAAPNLMLGNYSQVWLGIAYQAVWFTGLLWVATRIFTTDRIVTMKLSFGKKRRGDSEQP